ncbi:trafficking protein particle complex subunit 2 isoform X1 [Colius striatus]|uniref:trafficking protein particle complex subunit 2 isoform X1 n=1 Tax=Colius striatus TaxID=57412 RepID=UPI002B1D5992|nr:trafficking protein particle complex subunit 2 isoform X1 [Colius striatus]
MRDVYQMKRHCGVGARPGCGSPGRNRRPGVTGSPITPHAPGARAGSEARRAQRPLPPRPRERAGGKRWTAGAPLCSLAAGSRELPSPGAGRARGAGNAAVSGQSGGRKTTKASGQLQRAPPTPGLPEPERGAGEGSSPPPPAGEEGVRAARPGKPAPQPAATARPRLLRRERTRQRGRWR